MTKNSSSKPKDASRTSFMFRSLHQDVLNEVIDQISSVHFHQQNSNKGSNNQHSTHVMGKFRCNNNDCATRGWGSKKIAILIRGYPMNGYNAVVFNQRCKDCNQLGYMTLDEESYVERIAYRLKVWANVYVEKPQYDTKEGLPHEEKFCEGCKRGFCQRTNGWSYV